MGEDGSLYILIVEDDKGLHLFNRRALETVGYAVESAYSLAEARERIARRRPDVILLDVRLPDGSGFDFCREIRDTVAARIVFLTAVSEPSGELEGLRAGGDDYLRKPYGIELLRERVKNVLRRGPAAAAVDRPAPRQTVTSGSLTLDIISAQGFWDGVNLRLAPKEFAMLLLLTQNAGKIMRVERIYETVWKAPMGMDNGAVKAVISRLRGKLLPTAFDIVSNRGIGYTLKSKTGSRR